MLDANLKTQLQGYLERLTQPVELVASLDGSEKSAELKDLLEEIATLSDKVTFAEADEDMRKPSFAIVRAGTDISVRFAGIPMGHEFTSLVLALLQVGGHPSKEAQDTIERVKGLDGDYTFETYFSQSCQNCPDVVQALNLMSVLNPRIRHTAIDGALFQDEVEKRGVMAVPSVFLNSLPFGQGRMSLEQILAKLDTGAGERAAEEIAAKKPYDVLVVGGGPAGAAAAIYAARKGIRTGIASERFGGQVLDTMGIENFISVSHTEGPKMAAALSQHVKDYEVDVMDLQVATKLIPAASPDGYAELELQNGASLKARTIVLSPGARWRQMNVPGEAEYRNKGVAYCPHCDGPLFKGKVLQAKLRSLPNATVIVSAQSTEVHGDGARVTGLSYKDRAAGKEGGEQKTIELEGIFVQIGLVPNTEWLKGAIALSSRGEIEVDARGATSVPGVFAAGDATTVPYKQIVIAMGDGAKAALSAFDHLIRSTPVEVKEAA